MKTKNKKGISPLIATVLVIGFTIVLAAMVITWGTKLFKTTTEETGKTSQFNLLCTTGYDIEYSAKKGTGNEVGKIVILAKNKNDKKIGGFLFVTKDTNGEITVPYSTDENVQQTTTNIVTPKIALGAADSSPDDLTAFGTKKYILTPTVVLPLASIKNVDIRQIAVIEGLAPKVCDNEQKVPVTF